MQFLGENEQFQNWREESTFEGGSYSKNENSLYRNLKQMASPLGFCPGESQGGRLTFSSRGPLRRSVAAFVAGLHTQKSIPMFEQTYYIDMFAKPGGVRGSSSP